MINSKSINKYSLEPITKRGQSCQVHKALIISMQLRSDIMWRVSQKHEIFRMEDVNIIKQNRVDGQDRLYPKSSVIRPNETIKMYSQFRAMKKSLCTNHPHYYCNRTLCNRNSSLGWSVGNESFDGLSGIIDLSTRTSDREPHYFTAYSAIS